LNSYEKAWKAIEEGKFRDEIVPVDVPIRKGDPKLPLTESWV
jgi:acetyl-CoA C-acetyltransferase